MKYYYFVCQVTFKEFVPEEDTYFGEELYSGIITAKNKEEGRDKAINRAIAMFHEDIYVDGCRNIEVAVLKFYETTSDARD